MPPLHRLSAAEQLAQHLRDEVARGRWTRAMPGQIRLAEELGVARDTVGAALRQLEREGLLRGQGRGRKRLIARPQAGPLLRPLRVVILLNELLDRRIEYIVDLQHTLVEAGHSSSFASKSLVELGMGVQRVGRLVEATEADAWVVCAGSREILRWFADHAPRAFALFGRRDGLTIAGAGPNKVPAYAAATRSLLELGHQRIILVARARRRLPEPGQAEQAFLDELEEHGVPSSPYNLPDWDETPHGLHDLLSSLYRVTPPTALIIDEAPLFAATHAFLAGRRLRVPQDVSLVCTDPDPTFTWCRPSIAHIRWDSQKLVRRIARWATNESQGKSDRRQTSVAAEFIPGGTIGPAPRR